MNLVLLAITGETIFGLIEFWRSSESYLLYKITVN